MQKCQLRHVSRLVLIRTRGLLEAVSAALETVDEELADLDRSDQDSRHGGHARAVVRAAGIRGHTPKSSAITR